MSINAQAGAAWGSKHLRQEEESNPGLLRFGLSSCRAGVLPSQGYSTWLLVGSRAGGGCFVSRVAASLGAGPVYLAEVQLCCVKERHRCRS